MSRLDEGALAHLAISFLEVLECASKARMWFVPVVVGYEVAPAMLEEIESQRMW